MKTLKCAAILLALAGLLLAGCVDKEQSPVAPADQSAIEPGPLGKVITRAFTDGFMIPDYANPDLLVDPGFTRDADGKTIIRGVRERILFTVTRSPPDLLTGTGIVEMNATADYAAREGDFFGKLTLTPTAAPGGVWELTWHGKGTFDGSEWTIPLKELGHGKGGGLTGMQCVFDHTITTSWNFQTWTGASSGIIISH